MSFQKYPSIENSYNGKNLSQWLQHFPELKSCKYQIQEKIHGSNLGIEIEPSGDTHFCRRSARLGPDENFYGSGLLLEQVQKYLASVLTFARDEDVPIYLYGELFGPGIQSGVDYGNYKAVRFFDLRVDRILVSPREFLERMVAWGLQDFVTPILGVAHNLEDALSWEETYDSLILGKPGNKAEGIVMKPLDRVFYSTLGDTFFLKKKSAAFLEKKSLKKTTKQLPQEIVLLKAEYERYFNKNRMQNLFSKEGPIQSTEDLGKYIKLLCEDAKNDFMKDYGEQLEPLPKDKRKFVLNMGGVAASLLRDSMTQETATDVLL